MPLQKINARMQEMVKDLAYERASKMFASLNSGKMLRSKLVLKIAGHSDRAIDLCAIIELIHLASLLHDDVIDDAMLRRAKPSINAQYGTKNAIMLGDILYSRGFMQLANFNPNIIIAISGAVCKLSVGELMDVDLSQNFNDNLQKYLQMIEYKTAALIQAASSSAAMLAGLDDKPYEIYGKNLGLAFQIIDDILDITGDEKSLGKPAMNDYKEGKTTLVYILLYQKLENADKIKLKSLFKKELSPDELAWLKDKISKHNIITECKKIAHQYSQLAIQATPNTELSSIAADMINRSF